MRRAAVSVAAFGFFVLAAIGMASGVPPFVCACRALVGGAVLFALVVVAGRIVVEAVVKVVVGRGPNTSSGKDASRESGN